MLLKGSTSSGAHPDRSEPWLGPGWGLVEPPAKSHQIWASASGDASSTGTFHGHPRKRSRPGTWASGGWGRLFQSRPGGPRTAPPWAARRTLGSRSGRACSRALHPSSLLTVLFSVPCLHVVQNPSQEVTRYLPAVLI